LGDRAILRGNFADYQISYDSATHQYTLVDQAPGRDGTDVIQNVEYFGFADGMKTAGQLVNTAPVAADDSASTLRGQPVAVDVLANDSDADAGDTLAISAFTQGAHGSVEWASGQLAYTPLENWYGTDSFTYTVADANGGSATATVSVTVDNAIFGDEFDNVMFGTSEADRIYGLGGHDWLSTSGPFYGQTGADLLDGGAGNDRLGVYSGGLTHTLTGGSGADLFELYKYGDASWIAAPITITDFNAAEGDRLQLNILGNGPALLRGAAPIGFTGTLGEAVPGAEQGSGVVQLWTLESNGHTVLFADTNADFVVDEHDFWLEFDGSVQLAEDSFAAGSFLPFTGTPDADVFNGTAGADTMWGLRGDDTLNGLGGSDTLYGGAGNDIIDVGQAFDTAADSNYADGGEGDDVLIGSDGSDRLIGGSGNDTLVGGAGDDMLSADDDDASAINTLSGGSGNDFLVGAAGSDTLLGGEGNDYLLGNGGNDHLDAGNGSDTIEAGDGDDTVDVTGVAGSLVTATGGPGVDTYRLFGNGGSAWIKDFAVGDGGDVIALDKLLDASTWSGTTNPFDRQFGVFRMLQDGSATQLQWDQDGAGTARGWQTVATLSGTDASALTLGNFTGSSAITVLTVTDGSNGAPFAAASLPDAVANEDAAFAYTVPANTFVDRDTGDALSYRASLADGSALPSWLAFDASTLTFSGTPLNANVGSLDIRVTATDGAGASAIDVFTVTANNTNDAPVVATALPSLQTNEDAAFSYTVLAATFTDVDAGDSLHLSATLADGSPLPTWLSFDAATQTFSGTPANGDVGTLQVRVTATDNAGAGASSVLTLNVLNVNDAPVAASDSAGTLHSTAVTIDVLANDADVDVGDTLAVSAVTQGSHGSVVIDAASNKLVYTPIANWNGSDTFSYTVSDGHGGSATASVSVAVAGSIVGNDAANTLTGTAGSDSIEAKGGDDTVDAGAGNDYASGSGGNDRLTGGDGNDTLSGGDGNDTIYGSAGADVIVGGAGNDALYGGVSAKADRSVDTFVFNTALNASTNHDTIYGFEANATDKIALDPAIFAALLGGTSSGVDSGEFRAGAGGNAADANDFILYDTSTGNLYYDADGSGAGAKVWFATLSGVNGTLDYSDFTTAPPPGA
jgi:Ca2+-binding RTX toxin-like protein